MTYNIIFYNKSDGTKPVSEFIRGLEPKMKAKVLHTIDVLSDTGPKLREPHSKHLSDGIFELRVKSGSNISRVLYFFVVGQEIILTHGFIKKTQKTPSAEIAKAKLYRAEFLKREEKQQ